ncbi:MAG: TIGR04282 family arsenosugar biosynthesis glycosyltransferase [Verrucomicrobia bacterium]|nr:TIGR04282 family arsenosugar biosynthesis glycosyltransferase [Verrucomicrobiota bacterium]
MRHANQLLVFLRAPRPGTVKTRLAAAIGAEAALQAYEELLEVTVTALADLTEVELRFTPDDAAAEVSGLGPASWSRCPQGPGDLGERLIRAFADSFRGGARGTVVIGTDCPWIMPEDIGAAWLALEEVDVVLGPAADGGYWLIALREPHPELFQGISWGQSTVLAETRHRAERLGLQVRLLRELADVDTVEDWRAYQLAQSHSPLE